MTWIEPILSVWQNCVPNNHVVENVQSGEREDEVYEKCDASSSKNRQYIDKYKFRRRIEKNLVVKHWNMWGK